MQTLTDTIARLEDEIVRRQASSLTTEDQAYRLSALRAANAPEKLWCGKLGRETTHCPSDATGCPTC